MKILFLHGWQATPGGLKPTYLKNHGREVLNPALSDDDFDSAARIVQAEFDDPLDSRPTKSTDDCHRGWTVNTAGI